MISKNLKNLRLKVSFLLFLGFFFNVAFLKAQESSNTGTSEGGDNNVEETLIDFTEFEDRIQSSDLFPKEDATQNKKLGELTRDELNSETLQPNYQIKTDDMFYNNWVINLNSSAKTAKTKMFSYAKKIQVKTPYEAKQTETGAQEKGKGQTVLGIRIFFPNTPFHSHAEIMPRFEIPTYYKDRGKIISQEEKGKNLGVIHNVGEIKKISMDVSGRNFRNGIALRLKDNFGVIREYFMGYSYFANWRRLSWKNPNYVSSVDFDNLYRVPLYPREIPFVKFNSLVVYRPSGEIGGDTVAYFRKIDLWFDYAIDPSVLNGFDIDDESNWGILEKRADEKHKAYLEKNADTIELLKSQVYTKGKNMVEKDIKAAANQNSNTTGTNKTAAPANQNPNP